MGAENEMYSIGQVLDLSWSDGYRAGIDDGICIMCEQVGIPPNIREHVREVYRARYDTIPGAGKKRLSHN